MELRHYLAVLRSRVVFILLLTLVAGGVAWLVTPKTSHYEAKALIYVGATSFSVSPTDSYRTDPTALVERLMGTYAEMLNSEPLASDAIKAGGVARTPQEVVDETTVAPQKDTQLLSVAVTDRDPVTAQKVVNGLADSFVKKVQVFEGARGPGSLPSVPAYIFQRADEPGKALSSPLLRNILLAVFFGLLVSIGVAILLDQLDTTIKNVTEAERRLQLPVLGSIPFNQEQAAGVLHPVARVEPVVPASPQQAGVRV